MPDMVRYSVSWRNPHTQPPGPRVLAAALVQRGEGCPPEVMKHWTAGSGYAVTWELVTQRPIRRWSAEAKGKARRRNLRARMEERYPLFAEIWIAAELKRRPSYYAGGEEDARPLPGGRA
jgi:hypothetical protein